MYVLSPYLYVSLNTNKMKNTNTHSYLVSKMFPPKKETKTNKVLFIILCIFFLSLCFAWFFMLTGFIPSFIVTSLVAYFSLIALH